VHRFRFNWSLRPGSFDDTDVVVGWDMDGYRLSGRTSQPFVAYIHGQLVEEASFEQGFVAASMKLQARAERYSVRRADRVVTVSARSQRRIAQLYGVPLERIAVVPPPFDHARWQLVLDASDPIPLDGRPKILCVARMYPRKNLASLVRATEILRRRIPDVNVVIAGDGPERGRLARLVHSLDLTSSIRLPGQISFQALVESYATSDVFCLPSLQEGFGLVYLEAMAAGLPIVACRDTAAEELIQDGVNGLLVSQRDENALAEALARLLEDAQSRHSMGAEGRARVDAYEPIAVAERFVAAIGAG
jgi:glycosyltransferase involved in cell wall biosynthesis